MLLCTLGLTIVVLAGIGSISVRADPPARPNFLVILTDDMGFSDLGCFGGEIDTPRLDALAAGGLRFTDFHNTARCWPTRATLMTGTYCDGLSRDKVTVAEVLRSAGYRTAMAGKWHLGKDPKKDGPAQHGFDDFYGTIVGGGSYWNPMGLARNTEYVKPDSDDFYYTDKIGEEAVRQIEDFAKTKSPFFHYVAFTAAHWPMHAPEKSIQKYLPRYTGGWEKLRNDRYRRMLEIGIIDRERWPLPPPESRVQDWETINHKPWRIRNMAIYAAMVDHMDQAVGRIVDALKRTGKLDNTLIVYFHDNGACSEHLSGDGWGTANNILDEAKAAGKTIAVGDRYDVMMGGPDTYGSVGHNWANAQNAPLRRYKANVHEGGACTPAIMHWPACLKHKPGAITRERGHVVDIMATCLELAGAAYPKEFQGRPIVPHESQSLVPVISGGRQPHEHPYFFKHGRTDALIRGDYKIVREGKKPWELYHLARDRTETMNIAETHPERVAEMAHQWEARWGKGKQ